MRRTIPVLSFLVPFALACAAAENGMRSSGLPEKGSGSLESRPGVEVKVLREQSPDKAKSGAADHTKNRDDARGRVAQRCPARGRLNSRRLEIPPAAEAPLHIGLKTYPQTLGLADHEVVLTFDDGPAPETTPSILAALRAECVRANFFVIGRYVEAAPDLVRRAVREGHVVGHHSYSHPSVTLRGLDEDSAKRDIDEGIEVVEREIYGKKAQPASRPHVPFFRFPGFADTPALLAYLDERHIAVLGADLWAADWLRMSPGYERRHVMDQLERAPNHSGIILFHDTRPSTAKMLPAFLRELKQKGYHVVQLVPTKSGPAPLLSKAPTDWTSETERIISRAWPKIQPGTVHGLPRDALGDLLQTPSDEPVAFSR